jgi:hypothetical protein
LSSSRRRSASKAAGDSNTELRFPTGHCGSVDFPLIAFGSLPLWVAQRGCRQ